MGFRLHRQCEKSVPAGVPPRNGLNELCTGQASRAFRDGLERS